MSKLNYADKVQLYDKPSIPEINKVTYNNMNNIKKAINQSTNYNIITEVSAGKIKCNLAGTLESGDIVPITIPTLTNASATMQFSADNGAHYYYIKKIDDDAVFTDYANTELSNGKYVLYFDGTNFILDKSKFGGKIETNVNTIAKNGSYTALGTATGVPNTSYSWFIEHKNSNVGTASAYQRAVAYSTNIIEYERTKINGTWGAWVNEAINPYPIGAIYLSSNSVNPNLLFGGTWEQISGRFLVGAGSWTDGNNNTGSFTNGVSGGEYKHTLTIDELASHSHAWDTGASSVVANQLTSGNSPILFQSNTGGMGAATMKATGNSQAHNNIPPYFAVYIWKRIA